MRKKIKKLFFRDKKGVKSFVRYNKNDLEEV